MTEYNPETGEELNPENIFNEGMDAGMLQFQEQLTGQLEAEGMGQDEIEAFFDPAPRRGKHRRGKINCSARQRATMPQICKDNGKRKSGHRRVRSHTGGHTFRSYDPAPVGGYRAAAKRSYHKGKGLVAGLRPMVLPGAVVATVYSKYVERAAALHAAGAQLNGVVVDGVFAALQYDLKNRPTTSIMSRLKANASEIVTPALLGVGIKYAAKKVKLHPKVNQVASMGGDALIGVSIGKIISYILDPPNPTAGANQNAGIQVTMQPVQHTQTQAAPVNSYSTPGGYF